MAYLASKLVTELIHGTIAQGLTYTITQKLGQHGYEQLARAAVNAAIHVQLLSLKTILVCVVQASERDVPESHTL